eukprot:GFKZ01011962.1.p2 GENE.GFKZ01011962.1~~GFKZ01011962.1.p2  ORF type:complete len:145 (+),score=4.51 GFKZ01011962.1:217-651(+)
MAKLSTGLSSSRKAASMKVPPYPCILPLIGQYIGQVRILRAFPSLPCPSAPQNTHPSSTLLRLRVQAHQNPGPSTHPTKPSCLIDGEACIAEAVAARSTVAWKWKRVLNGLLSGAGLDVLAVCGSEYPLWGFARLFLRNMRIPR